MCVTPPTSAAAVGYKRPGFDGDGHGLFDELNWQGARIAHIDANAINAIACRTRTHAAAMRFDQADEFFASAAYACFVGVASAKDARTGCAVALTYHAFGYGLR